MVEVWVEGPGVFVHCRPDAAPLVAGKYSGAVVANVHMRNHQHFVEIDKHHGYTASTFRFLLKYGDLHRGQTVGGSGNRLNHCQPQRQQNERFRIPSFFFILSIRLIPVGI